MSTLGDIATVAAPTVVAAVAIGASTWQQSRSRAFDRAEREKERQHDRDMRQAAQAHERKLSDLDYQRELVDDVIAAIENTHEKVVTLSLRWSQGLLARAHGNRDDDHLEAAILDLTRTRDRLRIVNARMILRFGPRHEAVGVVGRAIEAARSVW